MRMTGEWIVEPVTGVMAFIDGEHYARARARVGRPADAE